MRDIVGKVDESDCGSRWRGDGTHALRRKFLLASGGGLQLHVTVARSHCDKVQVVVVSGETVKRGLSAFVRYPISVITATYNNNRSAQSNPFRQRAMASAEMRESPTPLA